MKYQRKITFARFALGALQSLTVLSDQGPRIAEEEKKVNLEEEVLVSWRGKEKITSKLYWRYALFRESFLF